MENLLIQLAATSFLEGIAVVLAVAYVWLAARQNIWCWPCALVSTGIYTWLFWNVSLPFHTGLNFYYLIMAVYGLMKWRESHADTLLVQSWPLSRHMICIIAASYTHPRAHETKAKIVCRLLNENKNNNFTNILIYNNHQQPPLPP